MPSWIRKVARSLMFLNATARWFNLASREVFIFHFAIGSGRLSAGSERILASFMRISNPPGARSSLFNTPLTSMAAPSLSSFRSIAVTPSSYTHCRRPSLFRRTTKATSPMSRTVWTAPFTLIIWPYRSEARISLISIVSFGITPVIIFIVSYTPFA